MRYNPTSSSTIPSTTHLALYDQPRTLEIHDVRVHYQRRTGVIGSEDAAKVVEFIGSGFAEGTFRITMDDGTVLHRCRIERGGPGSETVFSFFLEGDGPV